ncbi:MAG: ATP-binding cassette domain-containing protein [Proteobacteria bacterium]|nr:ATP-binding cassette domain-containing protein [Pseudomonadota bacterium]
MASPPRLRAENLRSALAGPFDVSVAAGRCLAVTGASGSGKSLFLRMIADLDPNTGEVWLDGRARSAFTAPAWRRAVAYAAAEPGWWTETVADHFPDLPAARAMAARLGLKEALLDGPVLRLSTGEKQRLALARTLLRASPVLLLDEPTGPLDEDSVGRAEALMRERLAGGAAIVMVTHDPAQAARIGDEHLVMRAGKLEPP